MTGGSEGGYGSAAGGGSADGRDRDAASDPQSAETRNSATSAIERDDRALNDLTPPRQPRGFRGWDDARGRDNDSSAWQRLRLWVTGLFGGERTTASHQRNAPRSDSDLRNDDDPFEGSSFTGEELAQGIGLRPNVDAVDASWHSFGDSSGRRPSSERPSVEDFEAPWDGTYDAEPEAVDEPRPFTAETDADAMWDEPRIGTPTDAPPDTISRADIDSVWSADGRDATFDGDRTLEVPRPPSFIPAPAGPRPKPQNFMARWFGRRPKQEAQGISDLEAAIAADWTPDVSAGLSANLPIKESELAPAVADFADDVESARVPSVEDFSSSESKPTAREVPDSVLVQAETAPARKSIISRLFVRKSSELPAVSPTDDGLRVAHHDAVAGDAGSAEGRGRQADATQAATHSPEEVARVAAVVEGMFVPPADSGSAVDLEATLETPRVPPAAPAPAAPPTVRQRASGFFSRLMTRVSLSQFVPKLPVDLNKRVFEDLSSLTQTAETRAPRNAATPAVPETTPEPAAPVEEPKPFEWPAPPVRPAADAPEPTSAAAPSVDAADPETTQPFPAFRDARDDIDESPVSSTRITEEVSVVDQFEKTDEFKAVPPPVLKPADSGPHGFFARLFNSKVAAEAQTGAFGGVPVHTVLEGPDAKVPFVLAKFRTFYNEIIRDKNQKSDVISGFATAIVTAAAADMANPEFASQLLSRRLIEMLELQAAESNWTGGDAAKYYPEAQYAMVALADETFATTEWPGRPAWSRYMLEPKMYGTRGADVEFFNRVDRLLRDPQPTKGARDLARLYLLVIACGFRGKYRVPGLRRPLAEYRRRLFEFSHGTDPLELYARDRRIFPDASSRTLASRAVGRFTSAQKWMGTVVVLAVVYLLFSHFAWEGLSSGLKDVMSRIERLTSDAGASR